MGDHNTANDAAIAAALSQQEEERASANLAHQLSMTSGGGSAGIPIVQGRNVAGSPFVYPGGRRSRSTPWASPAPSAPAAASAGRGSGGGSAANCPGGCGLRSFRVSPAQRVHCNACGRRIDSGEKIHSCMACNYDVCDACQGGGGVAPRGARPPQSASSSSSSPSYPSPFQPPFPGARHRQPHMCEVACVVGDGICVEMMVDSGAQTSVISSTLARELGLENRIDRTEMGVAAGVGRARISGRIRNVVCTLGNVEFDMDFVVLEVPDKLLLLGLDQLRRFKCIIDLEREVLVFGGQGGVEVPMLPPSEQHIDWRNVLGSPCSIM